ncbi:MAG: type III pantothenate kinase [Eubacterium sp.]|nr:type III pantothenate kinase [Eubacterium sp.]
MLIAIDIGNTDITFGLFQGKKLNDTFRMRSKVNRTSDEFGMFMLEVLSSKGYRKKDVSAVIIASVVPAINHSFTSGIIKYFGIRPIIVGAGIKTGIKIKTVNPQLTGADRIVDAVAAYELYGGPVIAADFGTATTIDLITPAGEFMGGVIVPGIHTAAKELSLQAAKLPEIEIRKPDSIIGKDTVTSMQGGLVYGYIGQTEYIIRRMKEESGYDKVHVVATGGLGKMIAEETDYIDYYDSNLTLKGLQIIYEKQR